MFVPHHALAIAAAISLLLPPAFAQDPPQDPGGAPPESETAPQDPQDQQPPQDQNQPDDASAQDGMQEGAQDQANDAEPQAQDGSEVLASRDIVGGDVVDASSQRLGRISDLVTDNSGEVIAIVERNSGATVGFPLARLRPSPDIAGRTSPQGADAQATAPRRFSLIGDREALTGALSVPEAGRIDSLWVNDYRTHFGINTVRTPAGAGGIGATSGGDRAGDDTPWQLSSIAGSALRDADGADVGTVDDVAIGFPDGRVSYALVSSGAGGEGRGQLQAVSLNELTRAADGRAFTTRLSADELRQGRGIEGRRLPQRPTVGQGSRADSARDGSNARQEGDRGDRGARGDRGVPGTPGQGGAAGRGAGQGGGQAGGQGGGQGGTGQGGGTQGGGPRGSGGSGSAGGGTGGGSGGGGSGGGSGGGGSGSGGGGSGGGGSGSGGGSGGSEGGGPR
jgi:sporulation protein YlmC with PRC-barrel domain